MATLGDALPELRKLAEKLAEKSRRTLPARKVNGVVKMLNDANNGCEPVGTQEWLNLFHKVGQALSHAKKSREEILAQLASLVQGTFFPALKAGTFSLLEAERIINHFAKCDLNGEIRQEAMDLLERQRRIEDANFRVLVDATLTFRPTETITFSSNWGEVERQAVINHDGMPQCRLRLTALSGRYTVWAVKATGELVMLAGEGLAGVKRPFLRQATEEILRVFVEKVVNAVTSTPPEAAPEPPVAAPPPVSTESTVLLPTPAISTDSNKKGLSILFVALVSRLEGTRAELSDNGITVVRQKAEIFKGLNQCRLRFNSESGYTVIAVNEKGKIYIFPGGKAFPSPFTNEAAKEWALKAFKALTAV